MLLSRQRPIGYNRLLPDSFHYRLTTSNPNLLQCCYCGKWDVITAVRFDLHEIIISRGEVKGTQTDEAKLAIHDRHNCGWVHQTCHKMAEGGEGRLKAIGYLIRYEGYENIKAWLHTMEGYFLHHCEQYYRDLDLAQETYGRI